jgi:hypothetical protein
MYAQSVATGKPISMKFEQPVPGSLNILISKTAGLQRFHAPNADTLSFIVDSDLVGQVIYLIF